MQKFSFDEIYEDALRLQKFHLIAFSISFENDLVNAYKLINSAGLNREKTLIFAGGAGVSSNPEASANLFDFIVLGEVDSIVEEIADLIAQNHNGKQWDKETLLKQLSKTGFIYVPSYYFFDFNDEMEVKKIKIKKGCPSSVKYRIEDPLLNPAFRKPIGKKIEFGDMFLIEISRGCPYRCSFCIVGNLYSPKRDYPAEEILKTIYSHKPRAAGLVAPLPSAHREFKYIVKNLCERGVRIGVSSLRVGNVEKEILFYLSKSGTKAITIAPETGNDQLRRKLGKRFTSSDVIDFVLSAQKAGIKKIKMYFMVGIPGESEEDVKESAELALAVKGNVKNIKLSVSLSPFVPKPHTPFEREGMMREEEIRKRIRIWKRMVKGQLNLSTGSIRESILEGLIATGGRWIIEVLKDCSQTSLSSALKRNKDFIEKYLYRKKTAEEILPWNLVLTAKNS